MSTLKFKKILSKEEIFEKEFNSFLEKEGIQKNENAVHPNGFNSKLGIYTNNLHFLQKRYRDEIGEKNAIKMEVPFVDCAKTIFPSTFINYRYFRGHLEKCGKLVHHCNLHLSTEEIKNILFKLFQRNVMIPKGVTVDYLLLGLELDKLTQNVIFGQIDPKQITIKNKILFNPEKKFTGKQRKSISAKIAKS